jgi:hypothetical protein
LWQRQPKGAWRWLLHEDGPAEALGSEPEMISGKVAECVGLPPRRSGFAPPPVSPLHDASRDGSLEWNVTSVAPCGITAAVKAWDGRAMVDVLSWSRPISPTGCGNSGDRG